MSPQINKNLSIVIPTFNRAPFLDYSLEIHLPFVRKHNIPIYVSDNASEDNTKEVVEKWIKRYDLLFYSKNEKNLGPDANFEIALKIPTTKYIWLLGDSSQISLSVFDEVMKKLNDFYDLIVLNNEERVRTIKTQLVQDKHFLLSELGWNMTQMSSLVYNRDLISNSNFLRYSGTRFVQTGVIFEYFAYKDSILVSWNEHLSIDRIQKKGLVKHGWKKETFDIWIEKWSNFVLSLPSVYSLDNKLKMIQTHNHNTKLFSFASLLLYRSEGFYNISEFLYYRKYFDIALRKKNIAKFFFVALLPRIIIKLCIFLYRSFINKKSNFL
jgi:abequosyltransferase